jgi:hypothetical protein
MAEAKQLAPGLLGVVAGLLALTTSGPSSFLSVGAILKIPADRVIFSGMNKPAYTGPLSLEERVEKLNDGLNLVLDQKQALEAELARVRGRLDALLTAFDERGTLGILQLMAHDKNLPPEVRIRAAGLAVPFERPKLAVTATTSVPLYDLLEERRRKGKTIEHDPGPPAA